MSIIKELKSQFSSIAWCPIKEHVSIMAVASMKDYVPLEEDTAKSLRLYDWSLEDVRKSQFVAETTLSSEISCISWGCTAIPNREGAQGLICLGMPSGCVELWIPCCSVSKTWTLEKVVLSLFFVIHRSPLWKLVLLLSKVSASTVTTGGTSFALAARMALCTSLIWPLSIIRKCRC